MIVDIDIGNTNAKWRCAGDGHVYSQPTSTLLNAWDCVEGEVSRVRIASVAGAEVLQSFVSEVRARWGLEVEVACVQRVCAGLTVCYDDVSRLGVDRWLAMLSAYRAIGSDCVVVSAGSAMTADWVASNGRHLGGFIAPGREKMMASLYQDVANVLRSPRSLSQAPSVSLGQSTEGCVDAGVAVLLQGFINHVASRHLGSPIILAGGDAHAMLSVCAQEHKSKVSLVSNPVLDGLAIALP